MADVHSKETRSLNMSRIRARDTKPELVVRRFLFAKGFRYKLHDKSLPGKPDLVFSKYKKVLFVNGCYWHGHSNCKYFVIPKTKTQWWTEKITRNRERDKRNFLELKQKGWIVLTVWECELRERKESTLENLVKELKK
jgi:DNA mismatch endonuclease, patch repair protein